MTELDRLNALVSPIERNPLPKYDLSKVITELRAMASLADQARADSESASTAIRTLEYENSILRERLAKL
jgi:hypothetical protein